MSRLKFVVKEEILRLGKQSWILRDLDGQEILAFSYFCKKTLDRKLATRKRYAEVVAHFIDYLIASQAFGVFATRTHINAVLDAYPHVLASGSAVKLQQILKTGSPNSEDAWLISTLEKLDIKPYAASSFSNTLAPINLFLEFSEALAVEAFEKASFAGIEHKDDYRILIEAVSGSRVFTPTEIRNMRANSMLGSVIRFRSGGIERPRGLQAPEVHNDKEMDGKDFPFDFVLPLAEAATSYRDRAFWLLIAASGLRCSEVKSLKWSHVNIETREIFVMDPRGLRFGKDMAREDVIRFKGRATSFTYLIYQFKEAFFDALELYVKHEYVPPRESGDHYIFQYVDSVRRGQPYIDVSDAALSKSFRKLCTKANVPVYPSGTLPVPHSLRHMYAMYMLNDFPLGNGEFGLTLAEVQMLVGHESITSTMKYARKTKERLCEKLEAADLKLMGDELSVDLATPRLGM